MTHTMVYNESACPVLSSLEIPSYTACPVTSIAPLPQEPFPTTQSINLQPVFNTFTKNILIKSYHSKNTWSLDDSIRRIIFTEDPRAVLRLVTGGILVIYDYIKHSIRAFEELNSSQIKNRGFEPVYVQILDSLGCFEENVNRSKFFDFEDESHPENQGRIRVTGLLDEDDATIKALLNMFGKILRLEKIDCEETYGYEIDYCDNKNSQAAYDYLNGCKHEGSQIKVSFCLRNDQPNPLTDSKNQFPSPPITDSGVSRPTKKVVLGEPALRNTTCCDIETQDKVTGESKETSSGKTQKNSLVNCSSHTRPQPKPTQGILKPVKPVPFPKGNELNIENIMSGADKRTTFMIRNIPNKYTQCMLISFLNRAHKGLYDFLYLRMDFKNKCNVGYAFINFCNTSAIISFIERMVGKKWAIFNSDKVCTLSYANIQGKKALINRFKNSSVMSKDPSYRPKIFYTSGPLIGEEAPFPKPSITPSQKSSPSTI